MEESSVALRTPDDCGLVWLEALTPPAHSRLPRVGVCTPPLIGPGQGTPHQNTRPGTPTAHPVGGGGWLTSQTASRFYIRQRGSKPTIWGRRKSADINRATSHVLKAASGRDAVWWPVERMHNGYSRVHSAPASRKP